MSISIMNGLLALQPHGFTTTGATNNNVPLYSTFLEVTAATANDAITGVVGIEGLNSLLFVVNLGSNLVVLSHNSGSSDAANRFINLSGADLEVPSAVVVPYKYFTGVGWVQFMFYNSDLYLQDSGFTYFGNPTTNGSMRIGMVGGDFVFQQRVAGTYTTFNTITP